ncbi:MAG: Nif11 family protein [Spirochaetales bacterium]|nr:Nif11 family protein [Spirochaetales bacterium]
MAQQDAINFIKEIIKDKTIRTSLYKYDTFEEIMAAISEKGYNFKKIDFDESIIYLKKETFSEDYAKMLEELQMWWHMLLNEVEFEPEDGSSCSPSKCSSCSSCG